MKKRRSVIFSAGDLIVFGDSDDLIDLFTADIGQNVRIKDLGRPKSFLCIELDWLDDKSVQVKQKLFTKKLIMVWNMQESKHT